jgi:prolyl 4-hydroxylase
MSAFCTFLVILILLILLIAILSVICTCKNGKKVEKMETIKRDLGYADINSEYQLPYMINNLITPAEINNIINYASSRLVESEVVGGKQNSIRNSYQCWIEKNNPLVKSIFERVSKIVNIPIENAEDLQVVRYFPGQYYNEHHDACCDNTEKCYEFIERGGQRVLTVLTYLNREFTEGETYFKNLDLKIKPAPGDAVVFYPLAHNSTKCHPLALHAGLPVTSGEKWICNIWFRENKFI